MEIKRKTEIPHHHIKREGVLWGVAVFLCMERPFVGATLLSSITFAHTLTFSLGITLAHILTHSHILTFLLGVLRVYSLHSQHQLRHICSFASSSSIHIGRSLGFDTSLALRL